VYKKVLLRKLFFLIKLIFLFFNIVNLRIDVVQEHDKPLGDRINMVFSSTTVTKGRGKGIVVNTAMETEIGKIARTLATTSVVTRTPLQKRYYYNIKIYIYTVYIQKNFKTFNLINL
jgi:magnesium-transporting ATPase (P-type)